MQNDHSGDSGRFPYYGYPPQNNVTNENEAAYVPDAYNREVPAGAPVYVPVYSPIPAPAAVPTAAPIAASVPAPAAAPIVAPAAAAPVATPAAAAQVTVPAAAPVGAPAERTDAPAPEKIAPPVRRSPMYNFNNAAIPPADEWSDPIYSQTHETVSNMYTPGIYTNQPYSYSSAHARKEKRKHRDRKGTAGKIIRAACLILVCVILSGAASYGVMEYRFNRGDFTVVNQVVLGNTPGPDNNSGLSAPVSTNGTGITPEDIYDLACTQVVGITTTTEASNDYFGGMLPGSTTAVAGSGFIISSDGYILTNYHVVETAYTSNLPLTVRLYDGTEYKAKIIGFDKNIDVAVIRIQATGLNPASIANSDNIKVGQYVFAVGNPLGDLVYTMTDGIISARDREVSVEGKMINTFQFSAAVNSGNSGGPLYDTNGEVVGIVTAKPMRNTVEGIGFAIPINDAIAIAAELIEHGYITGRPLMGITVETVTRAHAEYYGWVVGVYVKSVSQGSAAETAQMHVGDIIIKMGDSEVDSYETLAFVMRKLKAGDTVPLTVWRAGEEIVLTITFDEDPAAGQARR